jgi:hypothetical protein
MKLISILIAAVMTAGCSCTGGGDERPPFEMGQEYSTQCVEEDNMQQRRYISAGFVFDQVLAKRAWLVGSWCPDQTVLLRMKPTLGLARDELERLKLALEADGCVVLENTEATFAEHINPAEVEWADNNLKGAIAASVSSCVTLSGDLAIRIGWYKGTLHARSTTLLFSWNGEEWIERDDVKIVTVS